MSRPVTPASHVPPAQGTLSRAASQRMVSGASPPSQSIRSRANSQRIVSGASASGHGALSRSNSQRMVSTGSRPVSRAGGDATGVQVTDHHPGSAQDATTSALTQPDYHEEHSRHDAASGLQRSNSQMSQSATAVPSRGNTLKKKASLRGVGSVRRSGSRKSSYAGSVRSMQLGEKEKYEPSEEHNSAFYCPVPTTGSPTDLLADRFQGKRAQNAVRPFPSLTFHSMEKGLERPHQLFPRLAEVLRDKVQDHALCVERHQQLFHSFKLHE